MATTFANIYQDARTRTGQKSDYDTTIKGFVNDRYKLLANRYPWPWLYEKATIVTVADYDTGTAAVEDGSSSVTISSAATLVSGMAGRKFKVTGFKEIYTISSLNTTTRVLTLDNEYNNDDDSEAGYVIFQPLISLPSDCDTIINIEILDTPLELVGPREAERDLVEYPTDSDPTKYSYDQVDSSGNQQLKLWPPPYRQIVIDLFYKKIVTELSADTDEPLIPERFRQILKFGAMADIYAVKTDDKGKRFGIWEAKYLSLLREMLGFYKMADDYLRIIPDTKRISVQSLQSLINKGYDLGEYFDLA